MSALLLLAAAVAQPAPAAPLPMGRLIDEAIDGGRMIQAEAMLAQWRETQQPGDQPEIAAVAARLALEDGRNEEAEAQFAAMARDGVADCRVNEGLGLARLRLGRTTEAVAPLRDAVTACPKRWRAWNALGIAYDGSQSWAASSAAYERAFQLSSKPETVLNNYGLSLMKQRQPVKAMAIFAKARDIAPDDARILANSDSAAVMAGQEIVRRPGDDADGWARRLTNAGQTALRMGDLLKAQAYLSRAMEEADSFMPEASAALAMIGQAK